MIEVHLNRPSASPSTRYSEATTWEVTSDGGLLVSNDGAAVAEYAAGAWLRVETKRAAT